ncbi:MAG: UDP-N-acetylmuramate dehydrogenase [Solirubrobacterales bacterium]
MSLEAMLPSGRVKRLEPMARHTSFRIGGPADYFVTPTTPEEIQIVLQWARQRSLPWLVIGGGSNLLVRDGGIRGVVIHLGSQMKSVRLEDSSRLRAQAGIRLSELAKTALQHNLTGLEFAEGIPGTLGGGVFMNAGAYGGEIGPLLVNLVILTPDGEVVEQPASGFQFGYRSSSFQDNGCLVLEATLQLEPGDPAQIRERMRGYGQSRKEKQPLEYPSAGSTFRRPQGRFVGPMIEELGLKGLRVGDAEVSVKHAGFIVNRGHATACDVLELIKTVQDRVRAAYGVELHPEYRIVGENQVNEA